jgi:hypothetical protein
LSVTTANRLGTWGLVSRKEIVSVYHKQVANLCGILPESNSGSIGIYEYLPEGKMHKTDQSPSYNAEVKNVPTTLPPLPHTSLYLGRKFKKVFSQNCTQMAYEAGKTV